MNSPLMTSVVGTSTAELRPNAPLTPASAMTIASPATPAITVRFLSRHMPLHRDSGLEARRDDHFVIVHCAECDRVRPRAASIEDSHGEGILVSGYSVTRDDDDVVFAFELDVDRRGQIRQQLRMASLDTDGRD